ncbi:MAG: S24/S26 family peptidase [Chthoniobacterales bacterium]
MVPAILPGDLISVEQVFIGDVSAGEIVVFSRDGRLVAHRVVMTMAGANGGCLVTRGDRARRNDSLVGGAELIGRVTQIERDGNPIQARSKLNTAEQVICRMLRLSDHATGLYVRLAAHPGMRSKEHHVAHTRAH